MEDPKKWREFLVENPLLKIWMIPRVLCMDWMHTQWLQQSDLIRWIGHRETRETPCPHTEKNGAHFPLRPSF